MANNRADCAMNRSPKMEATLYRKLVYGIVGLSLGALVSPAAAATTYTYDTLGRLSSVTYDNGKTITYTYDAAGNRTAVVTG